MSRIKGLLNIVLYFVVQFLVVIVISKASIKLDGIMIQILASGLTLLVIGLLNRKYITIKIVDGLKEKGNIIKYSLYGFIIMLFVPLVLMIFQTLLGVESQTAENQNLVLNLIKNSSKINVILAIVIIAPILEEFVFRVSILGFLTKDNKSNNYLWYILSALAFALIHDFTIITNFSIESTFTFLGYFCPALVLAFIYRYSNHNYLVVVLIHMLNNLLPVLSM
ncbi:MAG: type II CAAX endopeptidase family protein [Erysipelotrichales bacterium]